MDETLSSPELTAYDSVPYHTQPTNSPHPENVAAIAKLCGLTPASPGRANILEIGCGNGRNIISLAACLPQANLVGIDSASSAIDEGQRLAARLNLKNLTLLHRDILQVTSDLGMFDYIICHGIFSWVPENVRRKILQIFSENLSERGLAYLSYNCYPGWHRRGISRDLMLSQFFGTVPMPGVDLTPARNFLKRAHLILGHNKNAWAETLQEELALALDKPDWYLLHDYLAPINQPFYFFQIAAVAAEHGLHYVADAERAKILPLEAASEGRALILNDSSDIAEIEQRLDVFRNTMFRRSIFSKLTPINHRRFSIESVDGFLVASSLTPEVSDGRDVVRFTHSKGGALEVSSPDLQLALNSLHRIWPRTTDCRSLETEARKDALTLGVAVGSDYGVKLRSLLLRGYLAGLLEFYSEAPCFTGDIGKYPRTSQYLRYSVKEAVDQFDLRNEQIELSPDEKTVLAELDGEADLEALSLKTGIAAEKLKALLETLKKKCCIAA